MSSAAQTLANQANARLSTGPRTAEGKVASSQNARSHGLSAAHLVIRPDERRDFEALRDSLLAELAPQGAIETLTFHELIHAAWNLHRTRRLEQELMLEGVDPLLDATATPKLDRILRYRSRAERSYYRSLKELQRLQTERALRQFKCTKEEAGIMPALALINDVTKQTRSEVTAEALKIAMDMINYETDVYRLAAYRGEQNKPTEVAAPATRTAA